MRRILVCGAGQSGLQLALGLQEAGYDVTVVSARTPDEIRWGYVTSTQCMFDGALAIEREQRLNLWDGAAPRIGGLG
ncbi:FAD-binding protein, partial [Nocardiopsis gilva]